MNQRNMFALSVCVLVLSITASGWAHFGAIIPSADIVGKQDPKTITLNIKFIHPLEQHYMEMAKPKKIAVAHKGKITDLTGGLKPATGKAPDQEQQFTYWQADFAIKGPGDYTFFVEPAPYWEPAEDIFIVHYPKICVNALGLEEGWDEPVGLETEIVPLTRPYGLWTGNVFQGLVLMNGKPVPDAAVEIEYLNESPGNPNIVAAPSDPFVTQVVKTDNSGVFTYAMPRAGWWGFSALNEAPWTLDHEGQEKGVEIGAVFWVRTVDMR